MANTKIFTFDEDIKYLQDKIDEERKQLEEEQNHWISGLEYGKYQNIYIC